jgi:hypothetical protein
MSASAAPPRPNIYTGFVKECGSATIEFHQSSAALLNSVAIALRRGSFVTSLQGSSMCEPLVNLQQTAAAAACTSAGAAAGGAHDGLQSCALKWRSGLSVQLGCWPTQTLVSSAGDVLL